MNKMKMIKFKANNYLMNMIKNKNNSSMNKKEIVKFHFQI